MVCWSALLSLLPLVSAYPHLQRSPATACGKFDAIQVSDLYTLFTNHWGAQDPSSGSQCTTLNSVDGETIAWLTQWSWTGDSSIKSFSNLRLDVGINKQLSKINSMPSTWKWSQENTDDVTSDVAYDLFTSYTAGGSNVNEIMIWLANYKSGPISYNYGQDGQAVPIASDLYIAGRHWNLFQGTNGYNEVYSFLPVSGNIHTFNGDIYEFFAYLIQYGYLSESQYLVTAEAGAEATCGTATLETSAYSLTIN